MTRWFSLILLLIACGACGAAKPLEPPPLSSDETVEFVGAYRTKLAGDPDLTGLVTTVADPRLSGFGYAIAVTLGSRAWTALDPAQQARVLDKIAFHLQQTAREFQPRAARRLSLDLSVSDDLGQVVARFLVDLKLFNRV